MKKRNPIFVFLMGFFTIFIYSWYWLVKTKGEMNKLGQKVPTAWIWLIPVVGTVWWLWKYSEAVENVTNKEIDKVLAFVVMYLVGPVGHAIVQDYFNKVEPLAVTTPPLSTPGQIPASPPIPIPTQPQNTVTPAPSNPVQPSTLPPSSPDQQPPNTPIIGGQ